MTSLMKPATPKRGAVKLGGEARVDLMPQEIRERQKGRGRVRAIGGLVVVSVVVAAAGYGGAWWLTGQANDQLVEAQNTTMQLQQAQSGYTEVTQLGTQIQDLESALALGTGREVFVKPVWDALVAQLPAGTTVRTVTFTGTTPDAVAPVIAGALRGETVATVQFTLESATVQGSTDWVRRISELPVVTDWTIDSSIVENEQPDGSGADTVTTVVTLNLPPSALANRYQVASTEGSGVAGSADEATAPTTEVQG